MKLTIHYFGQIAEKIGKTTEIVDVAVTDAFDLNLFFETKYPIIKNASYKIAIDKTLNARLDNTKESAEIALLPPFAGG